MSQARSLRGVIEAAEFCAVMAQLGPWEPSPRVAVAVSGGADSMAACLLTRDWARARGGDVLAIVIDHTLRATSAAEAELTCKRLAACGVDAVLVTLRDLNYGPSLAERARSARHAALEAVCMARGIVHLVFGHHAADQAETVVMRMLARSHAPGLAGMAALVETAQLRKLRPLLGISPAALRATLQGYGVRWVEDPSNHDPSQQRARLRAGLGDPAGEGALIQGLVAASVARGVNRAVDEASWAAEMAAKITFHPLGFAVLQPGAISAEPLAAVLAMLSGQSFLPSRSAVAMLAAHPVASTLGGVRIMPAGRLGAGWLLVREPAAMAPPVPAMAGAHWDHRFRLRSLPDVGGEGGVLTIGAWGSDVPKGRGMWPHAVLRTLAVLRRDGIVMGDPMAALTAAQPLILFQPSRPATSARFLSLRRQGRAGKDI